MNPAPFSRCVIACLMVLALSGSAPVIAQSPADADRAEDALRVTRVITQESTQPGEPFQGFDAFSLNVVDVTGDGQPEIVTFNDNSRAYVIDPDRGRILAEIETWHDTEGRVEGERQELSGIAVANVTGGETPELVLLNEAAFLTVLEVDAAQSTADRLEFRTAWIRLVSAAHHDPEFFNKYPWFDRNDIGTGAHGHPFVARVPDTGEPWIFAQSDNWPGQFAFDSTGRIQWMRSDVDGHSGPWVDDLDGDGTLEALYPTDNGQLRVFNATSGEEKWRFEARHHGANPGSMPVPPRVVDLDGDGVKEVFIGARVAVQGGNDPEWMQKQHAMYFLMDANGTLLWKTQPQWGNPLYHAIPVPAHVNDDGVLDLIVLDWNTVGHKPGGWAHLGHANLFALDGRSSEVLWRTPVDATWSRGNVAVADFVPTVEGFEVLAPARDEGRDGLGVFTVTTGERVAWAPLPEGDWVNTRGAALEDVNGDGFLEAVVPMARAAEGCAPRSDVECREGALAVFTTNAPDYSAWWPNNLRYDAAHDTDALDARLANTAPAASDENASDEEPGDDAPASGDGPTFAGPDEDAGDEWPDSGTGAPSTDDEGDGGNGERVVPAPSLVLVLVALGVLAARVRRGAE